MPLSPSPSIDAMNLDLDRQLSSYDYNLPDARIAQNPAVPRDHSRLLVLRDRTDHVHEHFYDLDRWLQPGDLLVLNKTKVIPASLSGQKQTGGQVKILLLEELGFNEWLALVKPGRKLRPGTVVTFNAHEPNVPTLSAVVVRRDDPTGGRVLKFTVGTPVDESLDELVGESSGESLDEQTGLQTGSQMGSQSVLSVIDAYGHMPLPPYITESVSQPDQYQTVYAETPGSAAAPTAGLHFTPELFDRLALKGIQCAFVTLHVGVGTFRPVASEDITQHDMHGEWIEVSSEVVEKVNTTTANGGRVIAIGTTSVRSLEGASQRSGKLEPFCGKTHMFIYPGYDWRVVDGMVTNFHLPKSSLLMLVSALIGRSRLLNLYQEAIDREYRFFSFGDAMLILPEAKA